jgi:DNA-binding response OmpR family regulator
MTTASAGSRSPKVRCRGWQHGRVPDTTLLILEDDDGIRTALRLAMQDDGYDVADFASAEEALSACESTSFDLMLVDIMLGGMDGFTFIQRVRPRSDAPIIVLSARNDTIDIVTALEAGADDYVTKPFVVKEVSARLKALQRRGRGQPATTQQEPEDVLTLDSEAPPLVLDMGAGTVRRGEDQVHLTVTEYRLLCELASPPGRVRSRQALLDAVWDRGFFGDERIVDVHVRRLRTKIERDPGHPQVVVTVRGLGYRLDRR